MTDSANQPANLQGLTNLEGLAQPTPTHPYAAELEKNLAIQRKMLFLLETRLDTLNRLIKGTGYSAESTAVDTLKFIEWEISKIRTQGEIDVLKKVIAEKENYYKGWLEQFAKDEAECNLKFKHTVAIAKKSTKPAVQKLLEQVRWERLEENIENKVAFYKQLRKHV